jgi:hypothetical protein
VRRPKTKRPPGGTADDGAENLRFGGGFYRPGPFGVDDGLFALDVGLAALFVLIFVILFSHNCLYFRRKKRFGVLHYEFLQAAIQSLFTGVGILSGGIRLRELDVSP